MASSVAISNREASSPGPTTAQGSERIHAALEKITHPARVSHPVVAAGIASWLAFSLLTALVENSDKVPMRELGPLQSAEPATIALGVLVAVVWAVLWVLAARPGRTGAWAHAKVSHGGKWLLGSGLWAFAWELTTAKTAVLKPPYLSSPQSIINRLWEHRVILSESLGNSLSLLAVGFAVGLIAGLVTGVVIGWWQAANYWVHPILIFIGPVPALAWVPIVFVLAPSAYAGAVFMIALSVWFPITVLTRAGILSAPRSYFDVAQTLGAGSWFLVLRVSLPAALPSIFTGAFMALGSSFVTLTVAENFGVNSGLGWYLNWQKSFGDYPAVYAGIVVLVLVCGLLLTLLFRTRNWVLRWEKGLTRW